MTDQNEQSYAEAVAEELELRETLPTDENMKAAIEAANSLDFDDPVSAVSSATGTTEADREDDVDPGSTNDTTPVAEVTATDETEPAPAADKADESTAPADFSEDVKVFQALLADSDVEDLFDPEVLSVMRKVSSRLEQVEAELVDTKSQLGGAQIEVWSASNGASKLMHNADNRQALQAEVDVLKAGYAATGRPVPPANELFARAMKAAFPDHSHEMQPSGSVAARRSQFTSPPDGGRTDSTGSMTPEERATRRVAEMLGQL